ncbi:MAG: outer membrane beta-barrel protein [Gemmatimonadaceae bacterium]|nr:outer membrane beta-barrel protein [Gemmatimonadaceae bacterium]
MRSFIRSSALALALLLPFGRSTEAQTQVPKGRIVGKVVDVNTGNGISDAAVQIVGTTLGTMSGVGGRFTIVNVPAGSVTIQVRRIGYTPKTVTGLQLEAGQTIEQNIAIGAAELKLAAVVVTSEKERGSVAEALDAQRAASGLVNAVTAEQIAKSPDSDAAAAAQRVSGVSVQDGKFIFVRGLGERYTTASLNGARLPSPEPERKVVPLDLFPSGILQSITTSKTFTPDLQGDFSGAQVDIRTREFPARRQVTYSMSLGANDGAAFQNVLRAPNAGGELVALGNRGGRAIPGLLANTNFASSPSQATQNQMILAMRNVWTPMTGTGTPNGSFGASIGGSDRLLGRQIGYLISGNYSVAQEIRANEENGTAIQSGSQTVPFAGPFRGETGRVSAQWGGIANFSTLFGRNTRLSWNNTYNRQGDNEARLDRGYSEDLADTVVRSTLRYVERAIWSTQLAVEQQAGRHKLDYSATLSGSTRAEPDRADLVRFRQQTPSGTSYPVVIGTAGARRLYFSLWEQNGVAQINDQIALGAEGRGNSLKVGLYGRATQRSAQSPIFAVIPFGLDAATLSRPGEDIFTSQYACATCANFNLQPIGQSGSYTASDATSAGYAMVDWGFGRNVRVITGARVERAVINVDAETQLGTKLPASLENTDILPSLVVNTRLSDNAALRFAASQTLARPEYRELAPILFQDVLGGMNLSGNADLKRSLIQNVDLRWEWYPNRDEILSLGVFFKNFIDPIERVEVATSGSSQQTYVNASGARNFGLELEARKRLDVLGPVGENLVVFTNATVMESQIRLGTQGGTSVTNPNRAMVGQAPYVINSGLTWTSVSERTSATLLYNRVGRRIFAAGPLPLPDIYDEARNVVDFSVRAGLTRTLGLRFDARNLMDARFQLTQGAVRREAYNTGRVYQFGFTWRQ